jgi:tetratricopeptide (TPR) repeat protein
VSRAGDAITDMTYFTAREGTSTAYCEEKVRGCDVYVGLIGLRYGSPVRDQPDISYVELEFNAATRAGLKRLVFLLDENAELLIPPARLLELDAERQVRQRAFRDRLRGAGVTVCSFASPDQLELELLQALQESRPEVTAAPATKHSGRIPTARDLIGRDSEVASLVTAWLSAPSRPVAVLGAPGIGKSAICLAALHDKKVQERFGERRWFIRCDGALSADALLSGLAAELGVIWTGSPGSVLDRVCAALYADLAVVVLDNFETPWTADPLPVEELLRILAAIPQLGLAVSARGTARPGGLSWRDFAMLSPLRLPDARQVFLAVAGAGFAGDPYLDELVNQLDGVPLAVELMGYAAQGQPDLRTVSEQWRQERVAMLQRMGGGRRELSVAVSVEASVTAPLMTVSARRLLALLGVLPDGVTRDDLTDLLPGGGRGAAAVLRQLGLAFDEGNRLRTLAPVREHVATAHPPESLDLTRAVTHYAQLAAALGDQVGRRDGAQASTRLQAESGNIAAMLRHAEAHGQIDQLVAAVCGLAVYWRLTGLSQPTVLRAAEQVIAAYGTPWHRARTGRALGDLALSRFDHDSAQTWYEQALPFYRQAGDVCGEANCIKGLGDIDLARSDHDAAQARYEQALPLYRQAGDVRGEANCIKGLGDIDLARSDHDAAQARYEQALPLYRQAGNVRGEANCIKGLGDIDLARSDHDAAQARYEQALPLYRQVGNVRGEANCIKGLGDIDLARSDHDAAQARYEQALPLYQAIPDPYSMGWVLVRVARLDSSDGNRARHWNMARDAWTSIGRDDLIQSVQAEFQ